MPTNMVQHNALAEASFDAAKVNFMQRIGESKLMAAANNPKLAIFNPLLSRLIELVKTK